MENETKIELRKLRMMIEMDRSEILNLRTQNKMLKQRVAKLEELNKTGDGA